MKITSGEFKYRNIEVPHNIRPTTEKVREAVFSMIREWIPSGVVLDLFAGSGAMGLEAISRGAARCYFCELSRANFRTLMMNIDNCKAGERAVAYNCDFKSAISRISEKLDIAILDPPYEYVNYYEEAFELMLERGLLEEGSVVIAEHLFENKLEDSYGRLERVREKRYGSIGVDMFICR